MNAQSSFADLKIINDPVHGTIEVHRFAQLIVNSPKFQRLRRLRQQGLSSLVYPSATNTRFEHSLGTYHLAWQLGKKLHFCLPEIDFSDSELLCVSIAGLCHDLGHGPFSHVWQCLLVSQGVHFQHEGLSIDIFDSIVADIASREDAASQEFARFMASSWQDGRTHRQLIGDLILGGPGGDPEGIPPEKQFLFEIVNNRRTGFDVDKMDYINRDALSLGLPIRFDIARQLSLLRVLPCPTASGIRKLLVLRDKQVLDYINLLVARRQLHYVAFQHVKSVGFELLLQDALSAARRHLETHRFDPAADSRAMDCLLDRPESLDSLLWLTDDRLVELLKQSCGPEAAQLMEQLEERRKYRHLASVRAVLRSEAEAPGYAARLAQVRAAVTEWNASQSRSIAELRKFDYGSGLRHPLSGVFCYSKTGEVRQCSGQAESLLFSDLQLAALHISVVRLYERTPREPPADAAAASESRRKEVADFCARMGACGFEPTAE